MIWSTTDPSVESATCIIAVVVDAVCVNVLSVVICAANCTFWAAAIGSSPSPLSRTPLEIWLESACSCAVFRESAAVRYWM